LLSDQLSYRLHASTSGQPVRSMSEADSARDVDEVVDTLNALVDEAALLSSAWQEVGLEDLKDSLDEQALQVK
jgi:hypothetical protein